MAITINSILQAVRDDTLDLASKQLNDQDIEMIRLFLKENPQITSLDVSKNQIGAEGAKTLAENTTLTSLNLHWNNIGAEGAKALAANTTLTSLDVSDNKIGNDGAKALAANTTLTSLNVNFNHIGAVGAKALAANATLTSLDLRNNQIGDEGAKDLAANATLTSLDVSVNQISDEGAKDLAVNSTLTSLNLADNQIGDEGVKALAVNTTLTSLNVSWNNFGAEGAKVLAANSTLTSLNIRGNQIGNAGAIALIANKSLTNLIIWYYKIDDEESLEQALSHNYTLITLDGIERDNIASIIERNKKIHEIVSPLMTIHLKQNSNYEAISKAIEDIKIQLQDWEKLPEEHYVSEVLRLLTGLGFQALEPGNELQQEQDNKRYALEQLLPDFTHPKLQRIANLRLSELLLNNDELLSFNALLLSLNGFRHDIEDEAFHSSALRALFKLIHTDDPLSVANRSSFNQKTVLLSHNQWRAIVKCVQDQLTQHSDAPEEEVHLLSALLEPQCYDLSLACTSAHLVQEFKKRYPDRESFTTPEHCLLMAQYGTDKMLISLPKAQVANSHDLKPIANAADVLAQCVINLKEALYQQFFASTDEVEQETRKSKDNGAATMRFFGQQHDTKRALNEEEQLVTEMKSEW